MQVWQRSYAPPFQGGLRRCEFGNLLHKNRKECSYHRLWSCRSWVRLPSFNKKTNVAQRTERQENTFRDFFLLSVSISNTKLKPIFTYTDVPEIESAVSTITNVDHQTIDVFENKCLCDSFLITLKYLMLSGKFDDETKSKINNWYFSDSPKYKILD